MKSAFEQKGAAGIIFDIGSSMDVVHRKLKAVGVSKFSKI
jgi:hypothetical protein